MLALVDQFPRHSRYNEAVSLDKEAAEAYMQKLSEDEAEIPTESRPMMSDFTLEAEMMLDVVNELKVLNNTQVARGGGHPGKPKFLRGPATAFEEIKFKMRENEHAELVAKFLPKAP